MNGRKKFHVEHDVRPVHVIAILHQLSPFVGETRPHLLTELATGGHKINPHYLYWNLKVLRVLGLTEMDDAGDLWWLTPRGVYLRALAEWNPSAFYDLMHYLYYASWDLGDPDTAAFSWTYQTVCNLLWDRRPTVIDGKALAAEVRNLACAEFNLDSVSITDYAIDGVYNWLRVLDPVFAWTNHRTRRRETNAGRSGCSPELFLMAVDYLYRTQGAAYNRPLLMDEQRVAVICRLSLLDPLKWKGALNRTVEQFGILHRVGSADGPQITLERPPRLITWPAEATALVDLDVLEEPPLVRRGLTELADEEQIGDEDVETVDEDFDEDR